MAPSGRPNDMAHRSALAMGLSTNFAVRVADRRSLSTVRPRSHPPEVPGAGARGVLLRSIARIRPSQRQGPRVRSRRKPLGSGGRRAHHREAGSRFSEGSCPAEAEPLTRSYLVKRFGIGVAIVLVVIIVGVVFTTLPALMEPRF